MHIPPDRPNNRLTEKLYDLSLVRDYTNAHCRFFSTGLAARLMSAPHKLEGLLSTVD
jgi:hypothetical protein